MRQLKALGSNEMKKTLAVLIKNVDKVQPTGTLDIDDVTGVSILVVEMKRFDPRKETTKKNARISPVADKDKVPSKPDLSSVSKVARLLKLNAQTGLPVKGQSLRIASALNITPQRAAGYIAAYARAVKRSRRVFLPKKK